MKKWRVLTVSSSVLLILLLIAFAIGLVGYSYLNQQLKSLGVTDWNIKFQRITVSHIVVKRLEITIDSLPPATNKEPTASLNLAQILSIKMPALMPEQIDIKSLHLQGTLFPDKVSATVKLLNKKQLSLNINSHQPIVGDLEIVRDDTAIRLKAHRNSDVLTANYDYGSGQLKADASYLLPAQQFANKVRTKPIQVKAKWRGNLSTDIDSASFEGVTSGLSGELLLSIEKNAKIEVYDSSTTATGQLKLDLNNGIINYYQLALEGNSENFTSLTKSQLPIQLEALSWNLASSDQLELQLLNARQIVDKSRWPIRLNAVAKGSNLADIKVTFDSEFLYQQQELIGDGQFLLGDHISLQHHSRVNSSRLKSHIKVKEFDWQQTTQLSSLLKQIAPQLIINKASVSGQTDLSFYWDEGLWQLSNGSVKIKKSDWVMDTLSVVNSNLDFELSANNKQLNINNAQLHIDSVQQGFAFGPVTAEFGLQLPFQNPLQSTLHLTRHTIKGLGGTLSIPDQSYSLVNSFALPVVFENVLLGELMRQYPSNKISIDGEVSGTIPIHWDSKQFTIKRGYLDALAPGGHLQVDSSALVSAAGSNPSLRTLAGVLSNFYYQHLSTAIDYDQKGKLVLAIQLKGSNPEVENGRPVELNVNLEEDLPALIKGLTLSNSLNEVIRKRVQQKIK